MRSDAGFSAVRIGTGAGFGRCGTFDGGKAVTHILRELVAGNTAGRDIAHNGGIQLRLYVLDRVLHGAFRHARGLCKAQISGRRCVAQGIAQSIQPLPQDLRVGVKIGFQLTRLHIRLICQLGNRMLKCGYFLFFK